MTRTFVLGVGAQKAGTTWLSHYLRAERSHRSGPIRDKELHIWDRRDLPQFSPRNLAGGAKRGRLLACIDRYPSLYYGYYFGLLWRGGIAADITPSYAGLSVDRLRGINAAFSRLGISVKTIFLMRDPVSRCVSAFNMEVHKASKRGVDSFPNLDTDPDQAFLDFVGTDGCQARTDYPATLASLRAAFEPEQIGLYFYETLFDPKTIRDFSDFLGVGFHPQRAETKANVAKKKIRPSEQALKQCAQMYHATYDQMAQDDPQLRDLWRGYTYLNT